MVINKEGYDKHREK